MGEAAGLLVELVRVPSPSGEEAAVARRLEEWARGRGLEVHRDELGVRITVRGRAPGPVLLMASHLDTVPPGDGWRVDPYAGVVDDGTLTARGAVDAKASVAAMAVAAAAVAQSSLAAGELIVLATFGEETRHTTMPAALAALERAPDAAVVGEPTGLAPAVAQRGLLILEARWRGEQLHAGWASTLDPRPANAIFAAARDLAALERVDLERVHRVLGRVAVTPTVLEAGVARNVTPSACRCALDVRTTPAYTHEEIVERLRQSIDGEIEVLSDRLLPAETPPGSRLLAAVERVLPDAAPFGSPTASDWVWLRHLDALKLGPGDSTRSHRPNEAIALGEVDRAAEVYAAIAAEYLP
ncbi:MAG TPA: M20/M25/M40 family metallo-hydrolase [Acidobacteria bacterium]|nr:M20/M25/M40 family metallo-hydrolase [Acidobacteriota bacterium]